MLIVPAASGADFGLAISTPLEDAEVPRGSTVSLSTNLGLPDRSEPEE
jgi:hypothetical protein